MAPSAWTGFTVHRWTDHGYDLEGRKTSDKLSSIVSGSAVTHSLTQYSHDGMDRVVCTAVRMNSAAFAAPPADTCALGVEGGQGPDRISRTHYDGAGRVVRIEQGVGTALTRDYARYTYTANGQLASVIDANNNLAELRYDGFDRRTRWVFPSPATSMTVNEADYEEYGYDANGNRTSLRKRDGTVLTFSYDTLNRITVKTVPERTGLAASATRDALYDYDLRGLMVKARFDSLNGEGASSSDEGLKMLVEFIERARRTGHEHLIENEYGRIRGLTNMGNPQALKHF